MSTTFTQHSQASATAQVTDNLVLSHLGYVKHILTRLLAQLPPRVDVENLESAGVLGLIEAARQFDPTRNVEFRTFAHQRIRGAILDELRRNCPLSQQMLQKIATLRSVRQLLDTSPTVEQLAESSGMPIDEVVECLAAARLTRPESWNESIHSEAFGQAGPTNDAEQREMWQVLADGIESLPDTMRVAVTLHYLEGLKLREVGDVLGLSESRVCRIVNSAREKLRDYVRQRDGEYS